MFNLICVTNRHLCREEDLLGQLERILQDFTVEKEDITDNSKPIVQDMNCNLSGIILREKDLPEAQYKELAEQVLELCRKYNVTCMLHNFPVVAEELHAPNIHLPMAKLRDMPEQLKEQYELIGASCHSVEEAIEAEHLGCSYIIAGHIFSTNCKKDVPPRGLDFLKEVCNAVRIPVYAIGGINRENIALVKEAGANGACIMSGFMRYESM